MICVNAPAGRSFWLYSGGGCVAVSVCQVGALIRDGPSKEALKKIYMQSHLEESFLISNVPVYDIGNGANGCFTTIGT